MWFEDFFRAQTLAHTIRTWQPIIVPGPLQIPDYARVLYEATGTPDDLIEERVAARIDLQQQTIERLPVPAKLIAVMDEAVLHRRVGSEEVMHKQLMHLAEQGQRKHIGIRVVPASRGANAGHVGAFTIASLDDADVMLMEAVEDVTTDKRTAIRAGLEIFDQVLGRTVRPGEPRTHHEGGRIMQTMSAPWRKSSYSGNGGQSCVEAASDNGVVLIRDTTDRERGPLLRLTPRAFADFTARIRKDPAL